MKKKKEQLSKVQIDLQFGRCKEQIEEAMNEYNAKIEGYTTRIANLKKQKRFAEAEQWTTNLKNALISQTKMNTLYSQVDQFHAMISEAYLRKNFYGSVSKVLDMMNSTNIDFEIKNMVKGLNKFEKIFKRSTFKFNAIFGKVNKSINDINKADTANSDMEGMINARLKEIDDLTTKMAESDDENLFKLK